MDTTRLSRSLGVLSVVVFLIGSYGAAYCVMVQPALTLGNGGLVLFPTYGDDSRTGPLVTFFRPAHWIDRRIRPDSWELRQLMLARLNVTRDSFGQWFASFADCPSMAFGGVDPANAIQRLMEGSPERLVIDSTLAVIVAASDRWECTVEVSNVVTDRAQLRSVFRHFAG